MHDIAVIGAGPYGLSIAAHLSAAGLDLRIFGTPMQTWRQRVPRGMKMKSEGFASTLYDPARSFRMKDYCAEQGIEYADIGLPTPVDVFAAYGEAFQKRFVGHLEDTQVRSVEREEKHFVIKLETGEVARFRKVIVATGIAAYAHVAPELRGLPAHLMTHSSACNELDQFAGKRMIVVGGGASAADCAALLSLAGADVQLVTRRQQLSFHAPPRKRGIAAKLRHPFSPIGPSWKSVFCCELPLVFHAMPEEFRLKVTRRHAGPAPCWFVRDQVERKVKVHTAAQVVDAHEAGDGVVLELSTPDGPVRLEADHVVAATGYKVDINCLPMLTPSILGQIRMVENTPILSRSFESSVPGLFFVGAPSANSFGPLVRFACGAGFTARRIAATLRRRAMPSARTRPTHEPYKQAESMLAAE